MTHSIHFFDTRLQALSHPSTHLICDSLISTSDSPQVGRYDGSRHVMDSTSLAPKTMTGKMPTESDDGNSENMSESLALNGIPRATIDGHVSGPGGTICCCGQLCECASRNNALFQELEADIRLAGRLGQVCLGVFHSSHSLCTTLLVLTPSQICDALCHSACPITSEKVTRAASHACSVWAPTSLLQHSVVCVDSTKS